MQQRLLASAVGTACSYCGIIMEEGDGPHRPSRDHCRPRTLRTKLSDFGGSNRVLCCALCNWLKGAMTLTEWLSELIRAGDAVRTPLVVTLLASFYRDLAPEVADRLSGADMTPIMSRRSPCVSPRCHCVGACGRSQPEMMKRLALQNSSCDS